MVAVVALVAPAHRALAQRPGVVPGVEVLLADSLHLVRGQRVGLITNHTGRDRAGTSTVDLLYRAPGVRLTALFAPEHGLRGAARGGERIASSVDSATGVPVYSLYGATMVPSPAMLAGIDVLVYDIQDVGARPYTFVWTMALAAGAAKKPFIVLDRPNPIRADVVEGGVMRREFRSLTGRYDVALRYGLTPGELIRWLAGSGAISADVRVVPMRNYRRAMWFDDTAIPWVNPSPNIRDLDATLLYPGTVFFEATNMSEGRGTDTPLTLVGAPWLTDAAAIAREMNALPLAGLRVEPATRTIGAGEKFAGHTIPVLRLRVTARDSVRPVEAAARLLRAVYARHPRDFRWHSNGIEELSGSRALRAAVEQGKTAALLVSWRREADDFQRSTRPYWLYP
ncbi:MAG: DUF1343 domain-containing protein [Gemmatimonadaceae bacterium]